MFLLRWEPLVTWNVQYMFFIGMNTTYIHHCTAWFEAAKADFTALIQTKDDSKY